MTKINTKVKKGYLIHKTDTKIVLCKIMNEYNLKELEICEDDLIALLSGKVTEDEILEKYSKKTII